MGGGETFESEARLGVGMGRVEVLLKNNSDAIYA